LPREVQSVPFVHLFFTLFFEIAHFFPFFFQLDRYTHWRPTMTQRGYTLLELALVCLISILVSTLGAGVWGRADEQVRLHSASRIFASALLQARSQAIAKNVPLRLHINPDGRRFAVEPANLQPASWQHLPSGVSFTGAPLAAPVFYSRGSIVPAGTYLLSNRAGSMKVILSPGGRIRWQRDA
jgi:hypothetical protein